MSGVHGRIAAIEGQAGEKVEAVFTVVQIAGGKVMVTMTDGSGLRQVNFNACVGNLLLAFEHFLVSNTKE